jgi:hypothetical protein
MSLKREAVEKNTVEETIVAYSLLAAYLIVLSSLGVLGYQVYLWLRNGTWKSLPAILVLGEVLPDTFLQWVANDASWLGVKKVICYIFEMSLASFLFLFALVLVVLVFVIADLFLGKSKNPKNER